MHPKSTPDIYVGGSLAKTHRLGTMRTIGADRIPGRSPREEFLTGGIEREVGTLGATEVDFQGRRSGKPGSSLWWLVSTRKKKRENKKEEILAQRAWN